MVVVALGSPKVPVTTCAEAFPPTKKLETASAPRASFPIHARKSIRCLLAGTAALASQGDSCEGLVPLPRSEEYPPRMNRSSTPQSSFTGGAKSRLHHHRNQSFNELLIISKRPCRLVVALGPPPGSGATRKLAFK